MQNRFNKQKQEKYPNGFIPKIQYWNEQFTNCITEGRFDEAQHCLNKMNYFIIRQKELQTKNA
jgi:hypothetical protein